ncbi:MAG: hypothetical protein PHW75_02990 [Patescibacteria group bacterium]|nr:hypothetical protein [Patescibacteria group bacterium]
MFKINLVPEVQQQKQKTTKRNTLSTIIGVSILAVCVAGLLIIGAIKLTKTAQLKSVNDDITTVEAESAQYAELEKTVLSLEEGLAGIKQILSGDNAWTKLLPHLEAATPGDIQYQSIALEGNTVTGDLKGKDINSLARMVESYKEYQVVVLKGSAEAGAEVTVSLDEGAEVKVVANDNGSWNYATNFNPAISHSISVTSGVSETRLSYDSETKEITSAGEGISAEVKKLFSSVETTAYNKEGNNVSFSISFKFDREAIW